MSFTSTLPDTSSLPLNPNDKEKEEEKNASSPNSSSSSSPSTDEDDDDTFTPLDDDDDDNNNNDALNARDLRLDADYMTYLVNLRKGSPNVDLARLQEVLRTNFLLDDEGDREWIAEELEQGYRLHTHQLGETIHPDPRIEEAARAAEATFKQMLTVPSVLQGLTGIEDSVESVDVVDNRRLRISFAAKKEALRIDGRPDEEMWLFHGTRKENEESILRNNFDLRKGVNKAYGEGIYFSELPSTSLFYGGSLFLCRVLPGLVQLQGVFGRPSFDAERYDSYRHHHQSGRTDIADFVGNYLVKGSDQILPFCVIRVKDDFRGKLGRHEYGKKTSWFQSCSII